MKKISSFITALSITIVSIFTSMVNANAVENNNSEKEYINKVIEAYLDSNDLSKQNVKISQSFDYYNLTSGKVEGHEYIVYSENEAKGLLYVNTTNDKFYSSFRLSAPDLSDELSCEDAETAFGYYDDVPILISNEKFYNSDSGAEITSVNDVSDEVLTDRINQTAITITKKSVRKAKRSAPNSSFSCSLDVTPVSNTSINGNGGICWAASIAAKHNYEYGNTPDMDEYVDATEVFYTVAGCTGNSNPTGTPQNTKLGLACFGLYNTYKAGALNINQVYEELSHDNPIIISVAAPRFAHSLVLCGVTYNGTTGTYTFADSNFSSPLTIFVDSDAAVDGSNFIYTSDTITGAYNSHFRNWYQTYSYHYAS